MKTMEKLTEISNENGGIIETKMAVQQGVSRATLSMYCKQGKIERITYGQYALKKEEKDRYYSLCKDRKPFVFSHETALYLQDILDSEPPKPSVTVPSGITPSVAIRSLCNVYYIKADLIDLGKTTVRTPEGNEVAVYDFERTVCDMVRCCKRVGENNVLKAIESYLCDPDKNVKKLFEYADRLHISLRMYQYWSQLTGGIETIKTGK